MHRVLIFCVFVTLSVAAPAIEDAQAELLSYENNIDHQGNYRFSFKTSNGIGRQEYGRLVNVGQPDEHIEVKGVYSYTDSEGKTIVINYWADENGYHTYKDSMQPVYQPASFAASPALVATLLG